jgi:hypothetical protein
VNPALDDLPRPGRHLAALVVAPVVIAIVVVAGTFAVLGGGGSATPAGAVPLELASVPDAIAGHYHAAEEHPALYRDVPCFCGCEGFLGHRDLYDCFVRADGAGWEAHAAGCGVCIAESATVQDLHATGTAPAAIRAAIVDRYGATTPTTAPAT